MQTLEFRLQEILISKEMHNSIECTDNSSKNIIEKVYNALLKDKESVEAFEDYENNDTKKQMLFAFAATVLKAKHDSIDSFFNILIEYKESKEEISFAEWLINKNK